MDSFLYILSVSDVVTTGFHTPQNVGVIHEICGARRDRTDDLLNAIQALSQLSYGPKYFQLLS